MVSANTVKCNVCRNRNGNNGEYNMSCKAYPNGIPLEIISCFKNPSYKNCNNSEYSFLPPVTMKENTD